MDSPLAASATEQTVAKLLSGAVFVLTVEWSRAAAGP